MERRDCIKALGAAAVAGTVPAIHAPRAHASIMRQPATIRTEIFRVKLRHTWTTTMSSSDYRDVLYVHYTADGITGVGEGAPIVRYHEDAEGAQRAVASLNDLLAAFNPMQFDKLNRSILQRLEHEWAAKSAVDAAVLDWVGQRLG